MMESDRMLDLNLQVLPYMFVSYCHEDKEKVEALLSKVEQNGVRLWYDQDIKGGDEYNKRIFEKIAECHVFCMMVSNNFVKSKYCGAETEYAEYKKKVIVPVCIEELNSIDFGANRNIESKIASNNAIMLGNNKMSDKDFINKLLDSQGVEMCRREFPVTALAQTQAEEPKPETPIITPSEQPQNKKPKEEMPKKETRQKKREIQTGSPSTPKKDVAMAAPLQVIGENCDTVTRKMVEKTKIDREGYVQIANGVKVIEAHAFADCKKLRKLIISPSVVTIEEGAFMNCSALKILDLQTDSVNIGKEAFKSCMSLYRIRVPLKGQIEIGERVFAECVALSDLEFNDAIFKIKSCAFEDCGVMGNVDFSGCDNLKEISKDAFKKCIIRRLSLPEGLKDKETLILNTDIAVLDMPDNMDDVERTFLNKKGIQAVVCSEEQIKRFGNSAGMRSMYSRNRVWVYEGKKPPKFEKYKKVTNDISIDRASIVVQKPYLVLQTRSEEKVSEYEYFFRDDLPQAILMYCDSISKIDEHAFCGINSELINMPNVLEYIGEEAFSSSNIKAIAFPGTLKYIGKGCLSNTKLRELVICEGAQLSYDVFEGADGSYGTCFDELERVIMPRSVYKKYRQTRWMKEITGRVKITFLSKKETAEIAKCGVPNVDWAVEKYNSLREQYGSTGDLFNVLFSLWNEYSNKMIEKKGVFARPYRMKMFRARQEIHVAMNINSYVREQMKTEEAKKQLDIDIREKIIMADYSLY